MRRIILAAILFLSGNSFSQDYIESVNFIRNQLAEFKGEISTVDSEPGQPVRKCGTPLMVAIDKLKREGIPLPDDAQEPRPTGFTHSLANSHFVVHYVLTGPNVPYQVNVDNDNDGHPDYVNEVLDEFEYVYSYITDNLGYNPPPEDNQGGDSRYDIYLMNLSTNIYGYTVPDPLGDEYQVPSWIELNHDFSDFADPRYRNDPTNAIRVTAAHEFFHAVQFGYDALEFDFDDPDDIFTYKPWWLEASSTWIEDVIYDNINDYLGYLPYFYNYPWMGLGTFSYSNDARGYHPYASCVWPIYLSENYGNGIVREIWESCATIAGYNTLIATDRKLANRSTSLSDAFLDFTVWNYHVGNNANTEMFYSEGNLFPTDIALADTVMTSLTQTPVTFDSRYDPPEHLAANYFEIIAHDSPGGIRVNFDGMNLTNARWNLALIGYNLLSSNITEINISENDGIGFGEFFGWRFFDRIIIVPSVAGTVPLYNSNSFSGTVNYDPTIDPGNSEFIKFKIFEAYPSPYSINGTSNLTIKYNVDKLYNNTGVINIYSIDGSLVTNLGIISNAPSTSQNLLDIFWDGKNNNGDYVSSGIYIIAMEIGGKSATHKIAVINTN